MPWLDRGNSKELLSGNRVFEALDESYQEALLPWSDKGYAILPGFFTENRMDTARDEIDRLVEDRVIYYRYRNKLMFAYRHSKILRGIAEDTQLLQILSLLLGKDVRLFQTINFKTGSDQDTHSDAVHMTTFPQGYLIAVWIALEDIDPDSGPLHYYPGSHKLPYTMNPDFDHGGNRWLIGKNAYTAYEREMEKQLANIEIPKEIFLAKKGDVLIWHANLLHGGEPVKDPTKTRVSMVGHYFADGVICYHEITQRPALF